MKFLLHQVFWPRAKEFLTVAFNELIYLDGQQVGYIQVGGYGHSLGGAVGIGFAELEEPLTADIVTTGQWEIEIAGDRVAAIASLKPLYDPKMEKVRA